MADKRNYTRQSLLHEPDLLVIYREPVAPPKPAPGQPGTLSDFIPVEPEIFIAVLSDSHILAFNGHVDLGTGIRTSLAQIVAEELNVPFDGVTMVLGHPFDVPNQGPTIASATIQITAEPLRRAAAQAREHLLTLAARHFDTERPLLTCQDGYLQPSDKRHPPIRRIDLCSRPASARHAAWAGCSAAVCRTRQRRLHWHQFNHGRRKLRGTLARRGKRCRDRRLCRCCGRTGRAGR